MTPCDPEGSGGVRRYPLRMPPGWKPPYPSFMSEFDPAAAEVAMAVMGCQIDQDDRTEALGFATKLASLVRHAGKADHVDLSACARDSTGRSQIVVTAYWLALESSAAFFEDAAFKELWHRHSRAEWPYGIFREVFNIPLDRFETLHSDPGHVVGIAHARAGVTSPIDRHAYWGSMRDRIPKAADDAFEPTCDVKVLERTDNRIVVRPGGNVAVIRSGQDLRGVEGSERSEYYAEVEPVLRSGMTFLRDKGREVNCLDCRYMAFINEDGEKSDHTFGLAYFRSLADLEGWSEQHPTHLAIFNAFLEFAPRYGPTMKSRYWHEVSVLPAENQFAEYINCAPGTGFLRDLEN